MGHQSKHRAIDSEYSKKIEKYLYSKTDEKIIASKMLRDIFSGKMFKNVLDVGAGPGDLSATLADMAEKLTLVEIVSEYEAVLRKRFPDARVIVDTIDNVYLAAEYDFIFLSHVLYYFPEKEWFGLVKRLHEALIPGGNLVIVMMNDTGDWWKIINNYWRPLRKYIRFDYIPLPIFKEGLAKIGPVETYPFTNKVIFDSKDALIDCIGEEILQINDANVLEKFRGNFIEFASIFNRPNGEISLCCDSEIIVMSRS